MAVAGSYPKNQIQLNSDHLAAVAGTLYSIVELEYCCEHDHTKPFEPGFEISNWTLEEVRFYSSLYLANGQSTGIRLYPLAPHKDVSSEDYNRALSDSEFRSNIFNLDDFSQARQSLIVTNLQVGTNSYTEFDPGEHFSSAAEKLYQSLDCEDDAIVRGLSCLLKSEMLFCHEHFFDAALVMSHIAMDCAFSFLVRELKNKGVQNPTATQAQKSLESRFGCVPSGFKFMEDYYQDRIRNFHVDNRFGSEGIAAFCLDDIIDLNATLKQIFYQFITTEIHPTHFL